MENSSTGLHFIRFCLQRLHGKTELKTGRALRCAEPHSDRFHVQSLAMKPSLHATDT